MVKKILNILLIPFKYIYLFIKKIATYIAKGMFVVLKSIKYLIYNFSVFVVYFLLYAIKGIYFVLKLIFKLILYILNGIKVFFYYVYIGIKKVLILIYSIIKKLIIYFVTGLYGIFIGIKKLILFISNKTFKPIIKNIYNTFKAIDNYFRKIVDIYRENLKKKSEEKKKKAEEERILKEKLLAEKKAKEEAKKIEKEKILQQKREQKEAERIEREKLKAERKAKEEEKREQKEAEITARETYNQEMREKEKNVVKANIIAEKRTDGEKTVKNEVQKRKLTKEEKKKEKERKLIEKLAKKEEQKRKKEKQIMEKLAEREKKEKEKREAKENRIQTLQKIKSAKKEERKNKIKQRVSLKERLKNWYNNLSFVRDIQNKNEMKRQVLLINFEGEDAVRSEEKILYRYVAKKIETGKIEKGQFAAFSKLDVHSYLLSEGYEVYEIVPQKHYKNSFLTGLVKTKMKKRDLVFFLTQLSTFLKSGLPLLEAVKIMEKQTKKKTYRDLYRSIIYELTMGENFSESLSKQGDSFPRLLINMIKSSELTGNLPETLDDMAEYYDETEKTRKQMVSAMMYPTVIMIFTIIVVTFIMIFVIPQFVGIYSDMNAELPGITILVINISDFLQKNVLYLILALLAFIIIFRVLYKSIKVFRTLIQWVLMHIPVFGKIIIYNEVTMFTKTFGSLLNHNVFITDSMEVLSKITSNEIYKMLIFDTITNLAKGEPISNSFKNHWAFPIVAYEMLLTGEKTGQLGDMMNKVANYYQNQHKNAVNQIKTFIEPIMIVFLTVIVGGILLSVILPMFSMYSVGF